MDDDHRWDWWKCGLARSVNFFSCVGLCLLLVAGGSALSGSVSFGGFVVAAQVMAIMATLACLLLIFGYFKDREAYSKNMPRITLFRLAIATFAVLFIVPVLHIFFVVFMGALFLAAACTLQEESLQLLVVVVCDGLFCLGHSAVMLLTGPAGPSGDFSAARGVFVVHSALCSVALPCLGLVVSGARPVLLPKTAFVVSVGYAIAAVHAGVVVLQGVAKVPKEFFGTLAERPIQRGTCIRSTYGSPFELVLDVCRQAMDPQRLGDVPYTPCPEPPEPVQPEADCGALGINVAMYALAVGLLIFLTVVTFACCPMGHQSKSSRVSPADSRTSKAHHLQCPQWAPCLCFLVCVVAIAVLGTFLLKCDDGPLLILDDAFDNSSSTTVPETTTTTEVTFTATTTTSDATTTPEFRTTTATLTESTFSEESISYCEAWPAEANYGCTGQAADWVELYASGPVGNCAPACEIAVLTYGIMCCYYRSDIGCWINANGYSSGGDGYSTDCSAESSTSSSLTTSTTSSSITVAQATGTSTTTFATLTTTLVSTTATSVTPVYRAIDWFNMMQDDRGADESANATANATEGADTVVCPDFVPTQAIQPPDAAACRCTGPGNRGLEAWAEIAAEQIQDTWCEVGAWAPVWLGLLLYASHGLAWSVFRSQAKRQAEELQHQSQKAHVQERRQKAKESGERVFDQPKERQQQDFGAIVQVQAQRDPFPEPVDQRRDLMRVWHV